MEVPRLGVYSELHLPAYTMATAMPDPSHICHLCHSSWKYQILNQLTEARNWTHNPMIPRWICFCCATTGTPKFLLLLLLLSFYGHTCSICISWARNKIRTAAASLSHSHSNIATPDPSCIWDLRYSLGPNPLSKSRHWTCIFTGNMSGFYSTEPKQELLQWKVLHSPLMCMDVLCIALRCVYWLSQTL